jgi:hypothetical protein
MSAQIKDSQLILKVPFLFSFNLQDGKLFRILYFSEHSTIAFNGHEGRRHDRHRAIR